MTIRSDSSRMRREPRWYSGASLRQADLPPALGDCLLDRGSLTQRLRAACPGVFRVRLLGQQWTRPSSAEIRVLKLPGSQGVWTREVYLLCDEAPWVFARTLIPPGTLQGRCRRLKHLGVRPLGEVLFADPNVRRGEIEIARFTPEHALHQAAAQGLVRLRTPIWGRRSVFYMNGGQLLIYELFIAACDGQASSNNVNML